MIYDLLDTGVFPRSLRFSNFYSIFRILNMSLQSNILLEGTLINHKKCESLTLNSFLLEYGKTNEKER